MGDIHSFAYIDPSARVLDPQLSIFLQPERIRIGAHSRVDGLVKLQGGEGLTIGKHVHIASHCTINAGGGTVEFGDHSGCSNGVVIASGMPDLSSLYISAADPIERQWPLHLKTVIGKHVVIFANATILPGVKLGYGCIIGAGAVVTKDVPAFAVAMGVPARIVGRRVNQADGTMAIEYLPKLRDLAAERDIERVRAHYGNAMPEQMAVDLVNFVDELTREMVP
ncbi:MAG: acyltransferase [Caldilineaceae bacterium]|nr:acyltransferase [Caldilineaceae bacterium]